MTNILIPRFELQKSLGRKLSYYMEMHIVALISHSLTFVLGDGCSTTVFLKKEHQGTECNAKKQQHFVVMSFHH